MNKKNLKKRINEYWENNKGVVISAGMTIGAIIGAVVVVNKQLEKASSEDSNIKVIYDQPSPYGEPVDNGRDCIITYSVEDTGEVLWKGLCTESYVNDVKESDMQYEAFRKLNDIE